MSYNSKYNGSEVEALLESIPNKGTYTKPSGGIPKNDLESAVQMSLSKADTALQSHQDISGKINGDGTITKIVKVSSLPTSPDAKTLYVIV